MRPSPSRYDAIVIGTGIGGSAAAALLAAGGLRVLILEKNPRIGGSCSYYEKHGFHIDMGTHMFSRGDRGPLGTVQRLAGVQKRIRFVQPRDLVLARGPGIDLTFPRDPHRWPAALLRAAYQARIRPWDVPPILRFFSAVMRMRPHEIDALNDTPMMEFVLRYTDDPRLVVAFGFLLGLYFVLPLDQVSAGEGIWCFQHMVKNNRLSYPIGGAVTVPQTFIDSARARGAALLTHCPVQRIVVNGHGRVREVVTRDGRSYRAPVVVSTSSLRSTVLSLVGEKHFPTAFVGRVKDIKGSSIAVQAKIGLDRQVLKAGCLVGGWSEEITIHSVKVDDVQRMYGLVQSGRIPAATPIYAPIPTNFDASLGPKGKQLITACAVAPTTDVALKDDPKAWTSNMIETLKRMVPEIVPHIEWVQTFSVRFIEKWIGKQFGPAISTGQVVGQVGAHRPPVRTPVQGLYVCGDGAGGRGVGTELAAQSAIECARAIQQDWHNGLLG
ncbi:MAG: NAD(P)/FAD-dependent oxidoreductase [Nitrospirae bacterium]|nr:NAD(P)/FAD-dependent oxidoreductase [Nitrospirota bacterium]